MRESHLRWRGSMAPDCRRIWEFALLAGCAIGDEVEKAGRLQVIRESLLISLAVAVAFALAFAGTADASPLTAGHHQAHHRRHSTANQGAPMAGTPGGL